MRILGLLLAGLVAGFLTFQSAPASANVIAKIDISQQRMRVYVNGQHKYTWKVSTGRPGYGTPTGSYSVKRMHRTYYSRKYGGAAMPNSLFFRGGFAVHGTSYVSQLGRPASHGCVRLHPSNARTLFNLVRAHGAGSSRIVLTY